MTRQADMERAQKHVKRLERYHLAREYEEETAQLIQEVRNETLEAFATKLQEPIDFYNKHKHKSDLEKGRIIGMQDVQRHILLHLKSQTQDRKEGENK